MAMEVENNVKLIIMVTFGVIQEVQVADVVLMVAEVVIFVI